jgi:Zn-dependent M28 family amino/carboxypeptidase
MFLIAAALAYNAAMAPLTPASLKATVEKLAGWHTRNTSTPELSEAADWLADQYRAIPGAQVEIFRYRIHPGPRVPVEKEVVEVLTRFAPNLPEQPGIIAMGAHLDTINMKADPMTGRAPGANDDGSGIAATLDVARDLSQKPHSHPLLFIAFSGEEQGLFGSEALAAHAAEESWNLEAVLSNDMIGNGANLLGQEDRHHVRVFSEESPAHHSRELARWIEWLQRTEGQKGFEVKLVFRADRFGRGGDHSSFNRHGFTAVRLVDVHEEYSRQHTEADLPEGMDFDYLSRNAHLNDLVIRNLANSGPAPTDVKVDRRQSHDSHLTWKVSPDVKYIVYWRETTEPGWTHWKEVGSAGEASFPMVSKDDSIFAVGAVGGIPVPAS